MGLQRKASTMTYAVQIATRGLIALWLGLGAMGLPAWAEPLAPPSGEVILTVTGQIDRTNQNGAAALDLAQLAAMGMAEIKTSTIWTDGVQHFEGVPLATVLAAVGASGSALRVTALNEYAIDIPMTDAVPGGPLLAFRMNGVDLSPRDKGPIWLVYPYDKGGAFKQEVTYARSIWQLERIEVLP